MTGSSAPAGQRAQQISIAAAVLTALSCARVSMAADTPATGEVQLQEVIVTATRHETSVQDVPYSISAVTGATLESQGVVDIAGLAASMPGMVYTNKGPYGGVSGANLIIRGLNSNPTFQVYLPNYVVPPVSTYVDDTPLFVNLRLEDLNRVEVLRGPQGTLYGSGSLGGTVRFIQNAPDPHAFEAKADVGLSSTDHAQSPNYDADAVLNVPLSPTFALRVAASYSDEAGYIDQPNVYDLNAQGVPVPQTPGDLFSAPVTGLARGTNNYGYRTARVAALWQPYEGLQMELNYYYQRAVGGGFPYNSPAIYGPHSLDSAENIREPISDTVNLVALTAKVDMGFALLTSSSSWFRHYNDTTPDLSSLYENFASYSAYYGSNPRALFVGHNGLNDEGEVEEIRLVSKARTPIEWVAGLYYEHENTDIQDHEFYPGYNDYFNACTAQLGFGAPECGLGEYYGTTPSIDGIPLVEDQAYIGDVQTGFRDAAAYGDVTWHVTRAWQVTGGTRVFDEKVDQSQQTGLLFDGPDFVASQNRSVESSRPIWRLDTSYNLNPTNLVYAMWSEGFRRGGVNSLPPVETFGGVTNQILFKYAPDMAYNSEVGMKGTVDGRFMYSLDVYDIQWDNVQEGVDLTALAIQGVANVGNAYSRGAELDLDAEIATHWYADLGYTYDETKTTSVSEQAIVGTSVPTAVGVRLPGTPLNAVFGQLEYRHALGPYALTFAVDGHYQGRVTSSLSATDPKAGGFTTWNLRVNALRGPWRAGLYVNNVSNVLGISAYTDPGFFGNRWTGIVAQPRTIGLSIGYDYK